MIIFNKIKEFKSVKVIFLFTFFFSLSIFGVCQAATLYLMPQSQTIYKDNSFLVELRLNTEDEEINAIEANLNFPSDSLEILDFNRGNSIFNLWPEEPKLKDNTVILIGGIPKGFRGDGLVLNMNILAKEIGKFSISFKQDSKVLLNDSKGTEARLIFLEGNYEILEKPKDLPNISSSTHSNQNNWYKATTLHLHWDLMGGIEYSYLLSRDPLAEPDNISDKPEGKLVWIGDMEYPNLEDGIYYFTLKQKLPGKDWSPKVSFRTMIDTQKPEIFKAEIARDSSVFEGKYFLSFFTTDNLSGIDHYEIKEGKKDFKIAKSPYILDDQNLRGKILVKALDRAGNEQISEVIPPKKPLSFYYILVLVIIILIVLWLVFRKIKKNKKNKE